MGVSDQYTKEMRQRFGYSATWVPTAEVRLGDVGILRNYQYERARSLKDFGIKFKTRNDPGTGTLDYASANSVAFAVNAGGNAPTEISDPAGLGGRIAVSFSKENAVFFQAADCGSASIEDQHALAELIINLYEAGDWSEDYVVITEVIHAKRATVLISSGSQATIEFAVNGNVKLSDFTLVAANAGLQVARATNIGTQIVAACGLTPLFKAKAIKKRLLRSPTFDRRGGRTQSAATGQTSRTGAGSVFLGDVDYDNYA